MVAALSCIYCMHQTIVGTGLTDGELPLIQDKNRESQSVICPRFRDRGGVQDSKVGQSKVCLHSWAGK